MSIKNVEINKAKIPKLKSFTLQTREDRLHDIFNFNGPNFLVEESNTTVELDSLKVLMSNTTCTGRYYVSASVFI